MRQRREPGGTRWRSARQARLSEETQLVASGTPPEKLCGTLRVREWGGMYLLSPACLLSDWPRFAPQSLTPSAFSVVLWPELQGSVGSDLVTKMLL